MIVTKCNYYFLNANEKEEEVCECDYCKEKYQNQIGAIKYALNIKVNKRVKHLKFCSYTCKMRYIKTHSKEIEEARSKTLG